MNLFRLENKNDYIELKVIGYEFEDSNEDWLMIHGKIFVNGKYIDGEDPAMFVYEFTDLKQWAEGMLHNKCNSMWEPTEPNLEFQYNKDKNELMLYFYPEHGLYCKEMKITRDNELFFFTKKCDTSDWEKIIKWCDDVIKAYPSRENI